MAANDFADWLQRGRTHMRAGRPIDAVLCFRRAAHANPRGADARFHLGEVLWQLGLSDEAMPRGATLRRSIPRFLAARLALAESLLARARLRGRAGGCSRGAGAGAAGTACAGRARSGCAPRWAIARALAGLVRLLSENPELSLPPAYAPALARVLEHAPRDALREDFVAQLVPRVGDAAVGACWRWSRPKRLRTTRRRADRTHCARAPGNATKSMRCAGSSSRSTHTTRLWRRNSSATHAAMCAGRALARAVGWPRPHGRRGRCASHGSCRRRTAPVFASACATVRGHCTEIADSPA